MIEKTPILRPRVTNPNFWYPKRPPKNQWDKIRKQVLKRDKYTCAFCGHQAFKYMNVHHLHETTPFALENLITTCVACHAVLHFGRNLSLGVIEIWKTEISQVEIIQFTRESIGQGKTLREIKKTIQIYEGHHLPNSVEHANELLSDIGAKPSAELPEPLSAIFVNFKRWQISNSD